MMPVETDQGAKESQQPNISSVDMEKPYQRCVDIALGDGSHIYVLMLDVRESCASKRQDRRPHLRVRYHLDAENVRQPRTTIISISPRSVQRL